MASSPVSYNRAAEAISLPASPENPDVRAFFVALFTPLARHMRGISPNALTFVSLLAGVAAGGAFLIAFRGPSFYALAALLLALSGAADSLDGIVARMYGRTSAGGDFIDHFCDRLVEIAILSGIAFSPHANHTLGLYVLVVTLLHSYLGTQIEASFGSRQHNGPGKAEHFVGLIAFALILAFFPELSFTLAGQSASLPNIFLAVLGLATLAGVVHRLVRALCASSRAPE
jgi:archaetidylinositol phosphate synthase